MYKSAFGTLRLLGIATAFMLAHNSPISAQTTINQFGIVNKIVVAPKQTNSAQCKIDLKYQPVCAITGHRVAATYSNECFAQMDHATVIMDGVCPQWDCSSIYAPVCARLDRDPATAPALDQPPTKAFINACMAGIAVPGKTDADEPKYTYRVLRKYGDDIYYHPKQKNPRFSLDDFRFVCPTQDRCPNTVSYVCAEDQNGIARIYKNKCLAVLAGADPNVYGGDLSRCDNPGLKKPR